MFLLNAEFHIWKNRVNTVIILHIVLLRHSVRQQPEIYFIEQAHDEHVRNWCFLLIIWAEGNLIVLGNLKNGVVLS